MKRLLVFLAAVLGVVACAQDGNTTLLLHCNGTMNGAQGEVPMLSNGVTYEAGILANGAYLTNSNQVYYPRASNFDPREGTLQFWVKPKWAGNDNQGHVFLRHGGAGGVLFAKDGGNYLRSIFNRYGVNGLPEAGVGINIDSWSANSWHNVAYTWSKTGKFLKLYVDGQLAASTTLTFNLPDVASTTFQIGADSTGDYANAVIDELEISNIARSDSYIASMYLYSLTVNSLSITPDSAEIYKSWKKRLDVTADTNIGTVSVPAVALTWTSNHPDVAAVQEDGRAVGLAAGNATLTGTLNGASDTVQITVKAPVLEPDEEQIEPYLSDLPPLFKYEMPVVAIRYIPTNDGITVDSSVSDFYGSIADLKQNIGRFERESKFMLQEGSRYHGYKNPNAQPSLGYRVVKIINVYEPLPPDELHPLGGGVYFPDYNQILSRINMMQLVNNQRVKEVWLWGYHHGNIAPVESNMSSPLTGDISNSYRWNDDLPLYDRTYTLYNYNYTRSSNEAVHDHGHQLEAILSYVAWRQDGNDDLFWKKFVGINESGQFVPGRCGDTHFPPNGESDYDYWNMNYVWSDVEDWNPLGT
ncbi:MAG: hypothetical protein JNM04_05590, partial [Chthonomonas sp.]|nr:hypothetical protein [Chthonomonas sp.]